MSNTKVCLLAKCHYKSADFMRFHHVRNSASNRHSCHSSLGLIRTDRITVTMDLNTHQSIRMHSFVLDKRTCTLYGPPVARTRVSSSNF